MESSRRQSHLPIGGLQADPAGTEGLKTAKQKLAILNRLLGAIASYAPVISRQFITEEALCLEDMALSADLLRLP